MFGAPTPILRSFDEAQAKAFYLDFLGFDLEFEHRFEPHMPLYMGIRKGACVLHISEHFGDGTPGSALRIPVDDVVALMADLRGKKYPNSHPGEPQEMPWGTREISIGDPSGNRLTFFTELAKADDVATG